jgi:outer membrane protein assembly factor BamB
MRNAALAILLLQVSVYADDWPQFRGAAGNAVSAEKEAPLEWGPGKNIRWKSLLTGGGNSSPIVSRGRVFVTIAEEQGKKRILICLDRKTGALFWSRSVACAVEPTQEDNPHCGSTPCADGERVIVWHYSAGLHCYDFDGKPLWNRDLGKLSHMWGYGSSPVLHGDHVLLNGGPGDRTFLTALDKRTGATLWQHDEPGGDGKKWIGSWGSPVVVKIDGKDQILLGFPSQVKAFDPASGKVLWTCGGLGQLVYADIVVGNGMGVATGEDEGGDSIAFKLGGQGDVTATQRLWNRRRPLEVSTGLILDKHLWTVDNGGIIRCTEVESGREVHKERSPGGAAWGSIVSAAGRFYFTTRSGDTVVFSPDPKGIKVLAVNSLGEPSNATPAFSDGEIFIRTNRAVYCIEKPR